jgi:hypothetical protein
MCKLLFLDIDGVLNSTRSHCAQAIDPALSRDEWMYASIDPIAVKLINKLVAEHDIEIVLSTSHRPLLPMTIFDNGGPESAERMIQPHGNIPQCQLMAERLGLNPNRVRGATPALSYPGKRRGNEIQYYLDSDFEWETYAIIDDGADMLPSQLERFVKTTMANGLTFEAYSKLHALFGNNKPKLRIPNKIRVDWETGAQHA